MAMGKVLVADDDKNICELLRLYLVKEGFQVVLAGDGEEALARFSAENPDIILLDVMMPRLDGWQVCREIRKKSECPIIMILSLIHIYLGSQSVGKDMNMRINQHEKTTFLFLGLSIRMRGNLYLLYPASLLLARGWPEPVPLQRRGFMIW